MSANDVVLNEEQRIELSSIAQARSLPAGYVFRARLILMLAEGAPYRTIKRQLRTTAPTISRWKVRLLASGIDGLDTRHSGRSATVVTPTLRARILSARGESLRMARRTGVAASWLRSWVSAKMPCIAPGRKPA